MSLELIRPVPGVQRDRPVSARARRLERKRLADLDLVAARLAELHLMRELVSSAQRLVSHGWLQHGWFAVSDPDGRETTVTAYNLDAVTGRTVSRVCLIGAVVHAGGGPAAATTQLVQRTLDLTWHTLYEHQTEPVRWCPGPAVRTSHVRDLTRWNDRPGRTSSEVAALLQRTDHTAGQQIAACRAVGLEEDHPGCAER